MRQGLPGDMLRGPSGLAGENQQDGFDTVILRSLDDGAFKRPEWKQVVGKQWLESVVVAGKAVTVG